MKSYPAIPRSTGQSFQEFKAHVWDKLDGQNVRAEWSRKRGWYKFGSRTQRVYTDSRDFGPVIPLFQNTLSEPLAKLAVDNRWLHLVVFMEYWGDKSLAGRHVEGDPMRLTLFDLDFDKRGLAATTLFLKLCENMPIPRYLGQFNWTREFVERVYRGEIEGITFEGVVGKAGEKHKIVMAKAKTKAWYDAVRAHYSPEEAQRIIES